MPHCCVCNWKWCCGEVKLHASLIVCAHKQWSFTFAFACFDASSALFLYFVQVVQWIAQYKPKQLARSGLVRPLLGMLCTLCAEPMEADAEGDDTGQLPAQKFASQVTS